MQPLKTTQSLCPICRETIAAEVQQQHDGTIELHKECPQHGRFAARIASAPRHYHLAIGASGRVASEVDLPILDNNPSFNPSTASSPMDRLSTCVALIEIVYSCNMQCPTCFADSPRSSTIDALPLDDYQNRINRVIDRKQEIEILQLSGGEPTLHPEFFELLAWSLAHPKIGHVLLNTNGIRLADPAFMTRLAELRHQYRKLEIYLQFDGPQAEGQVRLRGADMRATRRKAVEGCRRAAIPVTLAMTVDRHNLGYVGATLRLAVESPGIHGICWQPMFGSGRAYPHVNLDLDSETDAAHCGQPSDSVRRPPTERLNVADIVQAAVAQSDGLLVEEDFTPLPCGDPNCHTVAYLIRRGDQLIGLSRWVQLDAMQSFLKDRLNYCIDDLQRCGCDSEPLGRLLRQLEIGPESVLRLVIKPFMDVWTYDQHRVDRCCVHVIGEAGRLESFCRYYAMR